MPKDQIGGADSPTALRLGRLGLIAFAVLACITLLQAIIVFGLVGVPLNPAAVVLILTPLVMGVAAMVLVRRA
jgi:hypothetical protein